MSWYEGLATWWWNFTQLPEIGCHDRDIVHVPHPYSELYMHTLFKTVETSAVAGSAFTYCMYVWRDGLRERLIQYVPALGRLTSATTSPPLKRTRNTSNVHWAAARQRAVRMFAAVSLLSPVIHMAIIHYERLTPAQQAERALRLRYNKKSLFIDRTALLLGVIGFNWRRGGGLMAGVALATTMTYFAAWVRTDSRMPGYFLDRFTIVPDYYYEEMIKNRLPLTTQCDVLGGHTWASLRGSRVDMHKTLSAQL